MSQEMFNKNEISELPLCDLKQQTAVRAIPYCVF